VSAVCFFLGLKAALKLRTAGRARPLLGAGLLLALVGTVLEVGAAELLPLVPYLLVAAVVGGGLGRAVAPDAPAARLAWIPGLAGGAGALAGAGLLVDAALPVERRVPAALAVGLGAAALLLGAALAFGRRPGARSSVAAALVVALAGAGGAALGLALPNVVLLAVGAVAGAAGVALGRVVARAAGRSFLGLLGGSGGADDGSGYRNVRSCGPEEAAMMLETAGRVVIIPGFGMAAAQAQHAVKEVAELLEKKGAEVTWVVHPSAGCTPGHMNIVLDEANVAHAPVRVLEDAEGHLRAADVALVVGANDVVNPAAGDEASAVYGLPVPDLSRARSVIVIKRSLRPGAAGVKNPLFEQPNTTMLFGDAKKVAQGLVAQLKGAAH
jgi:NAD(P) transhydrogenase subunit beta